MSGNVVRLVSSAHPRPKSCATCQFFHPNTQDFGWNRKWIFFRDGPSASALKFATCSAFGGGFANLERKFHCNGEFHRSTPTSQQG